MKIIRPPHSSVMKIIGTQNVDENMCYHMSTFAITELYDDGILIYNTFTGGMVFCEKDDKCSSNCNAHLICNWFFVSEDVDEIAMVDECREAMKQRLDFSRIITYTIFPTTDCNARCYYCFEQKRPKLYMNKNTAIDVGKYIASHCDGNTVVIRWFGGEPLCNISAIDTICSFLKTNGVSFQSKMASNGFLFNEAMIKKSISLWNLTCVQVTIDGTEKTYNNIKKYHDCKDASAFHRVLKNIQLLLNKGIEVIIRLNIDTDIIDEQMLLIQFINDYYGSNKLLSVYSHPLTEALFDNVEERRRILFEKQKELRSKILEYGYSKPATLPQRLKISSCIADDGHSVTILPDGHIGLCEHYSENRFIGDIYSLDLIDEVEIENIREQCTIIEECNSCSLYPQCVRLKCCPETKYCVPEMKQLKLANIVNSMNSQYVSFLEN